MRRITALFACLAAALPALPCAAGLVVPGPCTFGASYSAYGPQGGADAAWVTSGALTPDPILAPGQVGTSIWQSASFGVDYSLNLSAWYSVVESADQCVVTGSLTLVCHVNNPTSVPAWLNANVYFTLPLELTQACSYSSAFWSAAGTPPVGEAGYYAWSDLANSGSGSEDLLPLFGASGEATAMNTSMGMGFGMNNAGITLGETGAVQVNISFELVLTVPAPGVGAPALLLGAALPGRRRPGRLPAASQRAAGH